MTITLGLPDDIARSLGSPQDLSRRALESFALEEVKAGRLPRQRLRRVLGLSTRQEAEAFLKAHGVYSDCPDADFERDLEAVKDWLVACD